MCWFDTPVIGLELTAVHRPLSPSEQLTVALDEICLRLDTLTGHRSDDEWLSMLCNHYSKEQETDIDRASCVFEEAQAQMDSIRKSLSKWEHKVLNFCGVGALYKKCEPILSRLRGLSTTISDLEGEALIGPADFAARFLRGSLPFQTDAR